MPNLYRPIQPFTIEQLKGFQSAFLDHSRQLHQTHSSLAWLDSLMTSWEAPLQTNQPVAVIELGGTNLRYGIAVSTDGETISWQIPVQTEVAQNTHANPSAFISWLADFLFTLFRTHQPTRVGFILSYPHTSRSFGKHITASVTKLTKNLHVPGLIGTDIGRALLSRLESQGHPIEQLVILNDAVSTVLSQQGASIGLVVGTGGNLGACHPQLANIRNVEAGNFDQVPHSLASTLIDVWEHPGYQSLEKQTTGRYLHRVLANQLIVEDIVSPDILSSLGLIEALNGAEVISQIVAKKVDWSVLDITPEQQSRIFTLAEDSLTNSAQLWGMVVASAIELNKQQLPEVPIIPVSGAVALQSPGYLAQLMEVITALTDKSVELVPIEDSIQGAAVAVLKE